MTLCDRVGRIILCCVAMNYGCYYYCCEYEWMRLGDCASGYGCNHVVYLDDEYNVVLPQYGNRVVVMPPLARSLYVLFLYHPEGLDVKSISDYAVELECIYRMVSKRNNPTVIRRVVEEITIPFNNTIYKNISIIRAAFYGCLPADVAQNYIPLRRFAGDKRLTLNCSFVQSLMELN